METKMNAQVSLLEFYEMLERHDWYYPFSDDGRVYNNGKRAEDTLHKIASQSSEHKELFDAFEKHFFTGEPWNNERAPKPEKPAGLKLVK
jgi:hypothetical protein